MYICITTQQVQNTLHIFFLLKQKQSSHTTQKKPTCRPNLILSTLYPHSYFTFFKPLTIIHANPIFIPAHTYLGTNIQSNFVSENFSLKRNHNTSHFPIFKSCFVVTVLHVRNSVNIREMFHFIPFLIRVGVSCFSCIFKH